MHIVKLIGVIFLAVYLIVVGLVGLGVNVAFVPPAVLGIIALVAGVLMLVCAITCCCCKDACEKTHNTHK